MLYAFINKVHVDFHYQVLPVMSVRLSHVPYVPRQDLHLFVSVNNNKNKFNVHSVNFLIRIN